MKLTNMFRLAFALLVVAWGDLASGAAQGTAFTYQGQLNANSIATEAGQTYQFTFTLWDAATGGTQHGPALTPAITVGNGGLFTVDLDFGQIFTGTQYWLDIKIGTSTGNEQELTARQPIYTVPVAQYALNAPVPSPTYMSSTASALVTTNSDGSTGEVAVLPLSGFISTALSKTTTGSTIVLAPGDIAPQVFGTNGTIGSVRGTAYIAATESLGIAEIALTAQVFFIPGGTGSVLQPLPGAQCTFFPILTSLAISGTQLTCAATGLSISYAAGDSAVIVVSAVDFSLPQATSIPISVSVTVGP